MHTLRPAPDFQSDYTNVLETDDGIASIGIHRVIFGWRVVAWYKGDIGPVINWCAGAEHKDIERLYSVARNILTNADDARRAFDDVPFVSKIKPFYNDLDFVERICRAIKTPFDLVVLPPMAD